MSDDRKWRIEKCRRGRKCWHVYAPIPPHEPDEFFIAGDWEFRSGAECYCLRGLSTEAGVVIGVVPNQNSQKEQR